jgi:hypothetical protein
MQLPWPAYPGIDQLATFNVAQRKRRRAEFRFEPQKNFGGQTVGEMKRGGLNNVWRIEVWKIPTRVPSNRASNCVSCQAP